MSLYIGLMSGTSMDGVDAALVDTETHRLIAGITQPYTQKTQSFLQQVLSEQNTPWYKLAQLNTLLGQEFASAAQALLKHSGIDAQQVVAIGSHGQTIAHDTQDEIPYTIQLGCPHTIAVQTNIKVVADFRTRDLVLGGQGAPFAPIYHQVVFEKTIKPMTVVNIGGIANITYLSLDGEIQGHDVGPGNCLLDDWVKAHFGVAYDDQGHWAATGQVIERLLTELYADPFFNVPSPKSIGRAYFSLDWLSAYLRPTDKPEDVQATLSALTARCITDAVIQLGPEIRFLAVCGGGVHNQTLMSTIQNQLPKHTVESTAALGIDPDYLEAMMFAWLAEQAMHKKPLDLRRITAANKPAILGVVYE